MLKVENTFTFAASPGQVFNFLSNPGHDSEWQASCLTSNMLDDGPIGVGSRYEFELQSMGKRMAFLCEITVFDPNRQFSYRVLEGPLKAKGNYLFAATPDGGTEMHWTFEADPGNFFGILPKSLLRKVFLEQVKKDMKNVPDLLESELQRS